MPGLANGATVDLTAPATDPSGYVFSEWTVNGAALTAGQKSVTFPAPAIWAAWGSSGSSDGQFSLPVSIAVDSAGNVYVTDAGNNRIQKFTSAGAYVTQWGSEGSGNGQFESPWGIATDSAGNVYVADELNNRIQKFTSSGDYVTQWGSAGSGNGQFAAPSASLSTPPTMSMSPIRATFAFRNSPPPVITSPSGAARAAAMGGSSTPTASLSTAPVMSM